jgi:Plavaka transposase
LVVPDYRDYSSSPEPCTPQTPSPSDTDMEMTPADLDEPGDIEMEDPADESMLVDHPSTCPTSTATTSAETCTRPTWHTPVDSWGLTRVFYERPPPSHDPDAICAAELYPENEGLHFTGAAVTPHAPATPEFFPYPNRSSFELGDWWCKQTSRKSINGFVELLDIIGHPDFRKEDIIGVNWGKINETLSRGNVGQSPAAGLPPRPEWVDDTSSNWMMTQLELDVPFPTSGRGSKVLKFPAGIFHHRQILSVIRERLSNPDEHAHRRTRPFEVYWNPSGNDRIRVYGELYSSNEFIQAEREVQSQILPDPSDNALERVVLGLMFWTDATLLANFGTAKLCPCYLFFGNDSKYRRAKVSLGLCNHTAYFESVSYHHGIPCRSSD